MGAEKVSENSETELEPLVGPRFYTETPNPLHQSDAESSGGSWQQNKGPRGLSGGGGQYSKSREWGAATWQPASDNGDVGNAARWQFSEKSDVGSASWRHSGDRKDVGIASWQQCSSDSEPDAASWRREAREQLSLAAPIIGMNAVDLMLVLMSAAFVGHLGARQLAIAQLATCLANASGQYVLTGFGLALETLGGHVTGGGSPADLGHVTYCGLLIMTSLACVISATWALSEPLLLALGQEPTSAKLAAHYMYLLIPSLFANAGTQPLAKFLQSQGDTKALSWASGVALILHLPNNWFFVYYLRWDLTGAAIATSLAYCFIFAFLLVHVAFSGAYVASLPAFSLSRSMKTAPALLKLGFFSAAMFCLEYIAFDVIFFFAGLLPDRYRLVSASAVAMNTSWFFATSFVGLGNAVSTRVATELGRASVTGAQRAARVGLALSSSTGMAVTVLLVAVHRWWPLLFIDGSDRELMRMCGALILFISGSMFVDAIQTSASAIVRGCGKQGLGAVLTLGSFYLVGVPASAVGAFVLHWKLWGMFGGLFLGLAVQMVAMLLVLARTDWGRQAALAQQPEPAAELETLKGSAPGASV